MTFIVFMLFNVFDYYLHITILAVSIIISGVQLFVSFFISIFMTLIICELVCGRIHEVHTCINTRRSM